MYGKMICGLKRISLPKMPMALKKILLCLLLVTPLHGFTQAPTVYESIWHKLSDRRKYRLLDSVTVKVIFFKDYFKKLDTATMCYIYPDTICYLDGYTAIGQCIAIANQGDELQTGDWTYYYPSGEMYAKGNFAIGGITECQAGGPSASYYNYKVGLWKYWYGNGQLLTEGRYIPYKVAWKNNCGSDTVLQSKLTRQWVFYDSLGTKKENVGDDVMKKIDSWYEGTFYLDVLRLPIIPGSFSKCGL
jgi:hypothetical protein